MTSTGKVLGIAGNEKSPIRNSIYYEGSVPPTVRIGISDLCFVFPRESAFIAVFTVLTTFHGCW